MSDLIPWEEELAAAAAEEAEAAKGGSVGGFFSLQGGILSYDGQPIPGNAMKVVVLASLYGTQYYESDWTPGAADAPDCVSFSSDYETAARTGGVPSDAIEEPQNEDCSSCPHFQWGSGKNGRGKACRLFARLALVSADALKSPDDIETAEVAVLKVPTMSVSNYNEYVQGLATNVARPPWAVTTMVSVVPDAKSQFKVQFKPAEKLPQEIVMAIKTKREKYLASGILEYVGSGVEESNSKVG